MLKRLEPRLAVTLVEANASFIACPFSNGVIAGLRELDAQRFGYDGWRRTGSRWPSFRRPPSIRRRMP